MIALPALGSVSMLVRSITTVFVSAPAVGLEIPAKLATFNARMGALWTFLLVDVSVSLHGQEPRAAHVQSNAKMAATSILTHVIVLVRMIGLEINATFVVLAMLIACMEDLLTKLIVGAIVGMCMEIRGVVRGAMMHNVQKAQLNKFVMAVVFAKAPLANAMQIRPVTFVASALSEALSALLVTHIHQRWMANISTGMKWGSSCFTSMTMSPMMKFTLSHTLAGYGVCQL
jgi:hypothetical protein